LTLAGFEESYFQVKGGEGKEREGGEMREWRVGLSLAFRMKTWAPRVKRIFEIDVHNCPV